MWWWRRGGGGGKKKGQSESVPTARMLPSAIHDTDVMKSSASVSGISNSMSMSDVVAFHR